MGIVDDGRHECALHLPDSRENRSSNDFSQRAWLGFMQCGISPLHNHTPCRRLLELLCTAGTSLDCNTRAIFDRACTHVYLLLQMPCKPAKVSSALSGTYGAQHSQQGSDSGQISELWLVQAGMGGGTGSGAAPIVAATAKAMGILTVAIVTTPFSFEGRIRSRQVRSDSHQTCWTFAGGDWH